jgi:uncharacterized protein YyaL (SSP411 family)
LTLAIVLAGSSLGAPADSPKPADGEPEASHKYTNALADERSPYLLQHAHNPVRWLPWSDAALKRAKREEKLIFLSIGYSTCHWCHVMEKECFEDEEVAALLNRDFICIKVDREERPDVDDVYMSIAQALGSGNGWPLTVVMTPGAQPFFAGTYIPKHDRFGIMGLMKRLPILVRQVRHGSNLLDDAVARVDHRIELLNRPVPAGDRPIDTDVLDNLLPRLMMSFDPVHGGFGRSMKFPRPHQLQYLLACHHRTGDERALAAVELTLGRIRAGGIYDQLGYGIHRYATDRIWKVPHFEKMLYDQAQLAMVCAECFRSTGETKHRRMTEELFDYVLRDLTSPRGGFYSAEDADSEGEEGKFYLWTADELRDVLSEEQYATFGQVFDIREEGNWIDQATDQLQPTNILYRTDEGVAAWEESADDFKQHFEAACVALLDHRSRRTRPQRDEKILADWNGLMIASLARGGRLLGRERYVQAAEKAFEFVDTQLRDHDGRLLHSWYRGGATVPAYLDDHVFLAWGAVELYKATYEPEYLRSARQLVADVDQRFRDEAEGGYFYTADDAQRLPIRPKRYGDMEVPSGNSVATLVLSQLAHLTGHLEYEDRAAELERLLARVLVNRPSFATLFAVAVSYRRRPAVEIVIVGDPTASDTRRLLSTAQQHRPKAAVTVLLKDVASDAGELLSEVAPFTAAYGQIDGKATAYVCRNQTCQAPTNDPQVMSRQLEEFVSTP